MIRPPPSSPLFPSTPLSRFVLDRLPRRALDEVVDRGDQREPRPADVRHRRDADRHAIAVHDVLQDRKSTRLNSSHLVISYAVFCLKKKKRISTFNIIIIRAQ